MEPALLFQAALGLLLLFFGRRLFWAFVGAVGFVTGFELVASYAGPDTGWLAPAVGLVLGVGGAVLAIFFQLVAAGVAGFAVGLYATLGLLGPDTPAWLGALAGLLGAILAVTLFGWALVILSAVAGAVALVDAFGLYHSLRAPAFLGLTVLGIAVQGSAMLRRRAGARESTPDAR